MNIAFSLIVTGRISAELLNPLIVSKRTGEERAFCLYFCS